MSDYQPLKYYFDKMLAEELGARIVEVYPQFALAEFVGQVAAQVEALELKERVTVIAVALRDHLPSAYPAALTILCQILGPENEGETGIFSEGYQLMPVAHFVELYGLEHFTESLVALYEITKRHTAESALRSFLVREQARTLSVLQQWVADENPHVRRLVSEGTRPRLPWAARLVAFRADPRPTLSLLEALKNDPSAYVRKSVANHLNDILKDNLDLALETLTRWNQDATAETKWIIRHALRNLIKQDFSPAKPPLPPGCIASRLIVV